MSVGPELNAEIVTTWLLLVIPLSISPGPANILFAASGSAFGVKATAPFWMGTNLICLLQSLAVGLGLGALLLQYPDGVLGIKYAGVGVLLYLAFRFFRSSDLSI